jgi:PAS domain S-box-containing protein
MPTQTTSSLEDLPIESALRRWAATGVASAVLLTGFMGFMSLRSARQASEDADWVAHTHAVETSLATTLEHAIDIETGSRGFAVTGDASFLQLYQDANQFTGRDLTVLLRLTADNPTQQRRLDHLESQLASRIEISKTMVAERWRTNTVPSKSPFLEGKRRMDQVRATVSEMEAEENGLLDDRTKRSQAARRLQNLVALGSSGVGVIVLLFAGLAIGREINKNAHMRAQLNTLNAGLEQRVQERTSALESEIVERKEAEQALARQAEELRRSRQALEAQTLTLQSVLDSMAEGLVAADEQGKFLIWNRAAENIVGHGPADLPTEEWSKHYGNYLPDGVTLVPTEQLSLVRAIHGETSTTEIFLRNPKVAKGAWIEAGGAPLKDQDGVVRGGVVAFRDITQRKADEREIRKLNDELEERVIQRTVELEEANKELEAFTYSVSHDLRAPLRHITGFTRILIEEFGASLPEGAQHHLQRIENGARRMGLLVDDLLNLTRVGRQSLSVQVTGLSSIVKDVVSLLEPETEARKLEWKIAELPFVECDPNLVRQVFQNLVSNALKYSRPRSPAVIEIGYTEKDGQSVIFVKDNGVGFSMRYADKLFGVFQRLHRPEDFEGTGVGLATVQRIIQKHGGRVWAEAELDKGATFYFTLGSVVQPVPQNAAATAGGQS